MSDNINYLIDLMAVGVLSRGRRGHGVPTNCCQSSLEEKIALDRRILVDTKIHFDETDLAKAQRFVDIGAGSLFDGSPKHIRMGKLGEIAFAKFLFAHGKVLWTTDNHYLTMEEVYVRPRLNLQTSDGKTVDVKTSQQRSIGVPGNRKESYYSDYYVGVQMSTGLKTGTIRGFVGLRGLRNSVYKAPGGYEKKFESLVDIGKLLDLMPRG